tara:strand:+ start:1983 stop:3254 length:1272 start_codon:yes stop_codon:yes gene_type:complete
MRAIDLTKMKTFNVNSAYVKNVSGAYLQKAKLNIWVYSGTQGGIGVAGTQLVLSGSRPTEPTYTLQGTGIGSASVGGISSNVRTASFEIAGLVKDFIESSLDGRYNSNNTVWVDIQTTTTVLGTETILKAEQFLGLDGYDYSAMLESENNPALLISNRTIIKSASSPVIVPVLRERLISYAFQLNGVDIANGAQDDFPSSVQSNQQIVYLSNSEGNLEGFRARVLADQAGNIFEYNDCLSMLETELETFGADSLYITYDGNTSDFSDTVIPTTEILYFEDLPCTRDEQRRLTFVNKFGALQDIWFYGNSSKKSLNVKSDTWNRRNLTTNGGVYRPTTVKNISNINEMLTLNSGFYTEENNVIFEELMQSNNVWLWTIPTDDSSSETHPVIIKNSTFNFKTSNTDKLINYTINLEFAFNKTRTL